MDALRETQLELGALKLVISELIARQAAVGAANPAQAEEWVDGFFSRVKAAADAGNYDSNDPSTSEAEARAKIREYLDGLRRSFSLSVSRS